MRFLLPAVLALTLPTGAALAQIETMPMDRAPPTVSAPAPAAAAPQMVLAEPPPVLPLNPVRRALEAVANGGSGGISYAGPGGAMNTSPHGSSCAVTCNMQPLEQYQVKCNPGFTAMCQCDVAPLAGCRKQ